MIRPRTTQHAVWWLLLAALIVTTLAYTPGLSGSWLFDDYPNIVDNHSVQPAHVNLASLVNAALSSPSSEFKRPLASLSFATNYLVSGLHPYGWKVTNLLIHLLNGWLVFLLARSLLLATTQIPSRGPVGATSVVVLPGAAAEHLVNTVTGSFNGIATEVAHTTTAPTTSADEAITHAGIVAALIAAGWMLLPINLTAVLYVVQRMESMANLFVLLGLIGYITGRRRMLAGTHGFLLCAASITLPTVVGVLAKETAVMLPLYALLIEWVLFRCRRPCFDAAATALDVGGSGRQEDIAAEAALAREKPGLATTWQFDRRVMGLFVIVLMVPMILGLAWLLPDLLKPDAWAARDFTLGTRLLSETRIVTDYIAWTLLPTFHALSFYHDNFHISTGLLTPWTTLASMLFLASLIALMVWLRKRQPLTALGIALFLGCQLLTGTILPLELVYEHRNYFASFGLLLAIMPLLAAPSRATISAGSLPMALPRYALLAGLILCWTAMTALTAYAWGNPLRLAEDLARRAPQSPRAEYELGRTYIIYSHYDPASPYTRMAYAPLEQAAELPDSSILPQQALIFMNSRMHLPLKEAWWDSMIAKLKAHKPGVQDESSLVALTQCNREGRCNLPKERMVEAFQAALAHPESSARLYATYGDYAWNVLDEHELGERMTVAAVKASPDEPAYQITLIRMLLALGRQDDARKVLRQLETLNIGGRLDSSIARLKTSLSQP